MPWCSLSVSTMGSPRALTCRLGRRVQCSPSAGMVIACNAHWPSLMNGLVDPTWSASSSDPPGRSTLTISATPARGSGKPHNEKVHTTASKDSSPNGSRASSRQLQHALAQVHPDQLHLRWVVRQVESAPHRDLEDLPHRPFAHPSAARHQIALLHPSHPLVVASRGPVPVTPHSFSSHGFRVPLLFLPAVGFAARAQGPRSPSGTTATPSRRR